MGGISVVLEIVKSYAIYVCRHILRYLTRFIMGSGQNTAWQMIRCGHELANASWYSHDAFRQSRGFHPWLGGFRNKFSGCKYCFLIESTSLRPLVSGLGSVVCPFDGGFPCDLPIWVLGCNNWAWVLGLRTRDLECRNLATAQSEGTYCLFVGTACGSPIYAYIRIGGVR